MLVKDKAQAQKCKFWNYYYNLDKEYELLSSYHIFKNDTLSNLQDVSIYTSLSTGTHFSGNCSVQIVQT